MRTDGLRRRQLGRYRRQIPTPVLALLLGCAATIFPAVGRSTTAAQARLAALPAQPAAPADNPSTPDRVALGRLLFWDPILSGQKDVACATCHHPSLGYSDGLDLSIGANGVGLGRERAFLPERPQRMVKRNSQTVLNVAFNGLTSGGDVSVTAAPMFWDLRVRTLEAQALEPIKALDEMRGGTYPEERALSAVVARLNGNREYRRMFARAFGGSTPVNDGNLGRALAAFQRTLVASNTPFDRYMRGDTSAMTPDQVRGMDRFQQIGCVNCHSGPMLSDFAAHVLAVPDSSKLPETDSGVNKTYAFRTPSLRNLSPRRRTCTMVRSRHCQTSSTSTAGSVEAGDVAAAEAEAEARDQPAGGAGSDRSAGPPAEHAWPRATGPHRVSARPGRPDFDRIVPEHVPSGLPVGGRLQR